MKLIARLLIGAALTIASLSAVTAEGAQCSLAPNAPEICADQSV